MIGPGIVAENSIVWRCSGSIRRIRSTSGRKPRSSISSASSSTSALTRPSTRWRCSARSSRRPGRADDDVDALAQRGELRLVGPAAVDGGDADAEVPAGVGDVLGHLHAQLAGRARRRGPAGRRGCGRRPRRPAVAAGCSDGGVTRCSSGTPKPSVLPMPVRAWPMTSSPARASGSVSSWIANVRSMPASASAWTISGRTPSSAKVGESGRTGAPAWSGWASSSVLGAGCGRSLGVRSCRSGRTG